VSPSKAFANWVAMDSIRMVSNIPSQNHFIVHVKITGEKHRNK
jgi:hypothetical protein